MTVGSFLAIRVKVGYEFFACETLIEGITYQLFVFSLPKRLNSIILWQ